MSKTGVPVLDMPLDHPRPVVRCFEGRKMSFHIPGEETSALKALALEQDTTLYTVLLAAYIILLGKLSGQDDIVVGLTTAGRRRVDLEAVIGNFITTLAARFRLDRDKTFIDFLRRVKEYTLEVFQNQDYPFENLVRKVAGQKDPGRNPLFDVMFGLLNMERTDQPGEIPGDEPGGFTLETYEYDNKRSRVDLLLLGREEGDGINFSAEYSTALFKEETVRAFTRYYRQIISHILEEPGEKIKDIELVSAEEKDKILSAIREDEHNMEIEFEI